MREGSFTHSRLVFSYPLADCISLKGLSDTVIHIQGNKKKKQQGGRSRNNSAGDKKYEKDRGRFGKTLFPKTSNTL